MVGRGKNKRQQQKTADASCTKKKSKNDPPNAPSASTTDETGVCHEEQPMDTAQPDDISSNDEDDSNVAARAIKRKTAIILTDEQTEIMVEWLKCNSGLYDKRKPLWMQPDKKNELWQGQAEVIGVEKENLVRWFNTQRRRLGQLKMKSKVSGQASIESEWKESDQQFFRDWSFLHPHIKQVERHTIVSIRAGRPTEQNSELVADSAIETEKEYENPNNAPTATSTSNEDGGSHSRPPSNPPSSTKQTPPQTTKRAQSQSADAIIQCLMSSAERHQELIRISEAILRAHQPPAGQIQERFRFKEWMGEVLNELPQNLYDLAEEELYRVIIRYRTQGRQQRPTPLQHIPLSQTSDGNQQYILNAQQPPQSLSYQWQPAPSQWNPNPPPCSSVWASQSCDYMTQYEQQQARSSKNRPSADLSMTSLLNSSLLQDFTDAENQSPAKAISSDKNESNEGKEKL